MAGLSGKAGTLRSVLIRNGAISGEWYVESVLHSTLSTLLRRLNVFGVVLSIAQITWDGENVVRPVSELQ